MRDVQHEFTFASSILRASSALRVSSLARASSALFTSSIRSSSIFRASSALRSSSVRLPIFSSSFFLFFSFLSLERGERDVSLSLANKSCEEIAEQVRRDPRSCGRTGCANRRPVRRRRRRGGELVSYQLVRYSQRVQNLLFQHFVVQAQLGILFGQLCKMGLQVSRPWARAVCLPRGMTGC